jgi:hypothetical protein
MRVLVAGLDEKLAPSGYPRRPEKHGLKTNQCAGANH